MFTRCWNYIKSKTTTNNKPINNKQSQNYSNNNNTNSAQKNASTTPINDDNDNNEPQFYDLGSRGGSEDGPSQQQQQPQQSQQQPNESPQGTSSSLGVDTSATNNSNNNLPLRQRSRTYSLLSRLRPSSRLGIDSTNEPEPELETRKDLITRLKSILLTIERGLNFNENDLETQLKSSGYSLQRAASDYLERSGLRQIEPGCTLKKIKPEEDNPTIYDAWSPCQPTTFSVRAGPNYRKTRLKAQAKPFALYDVIAVDMYSSETKVEHLSRFMKLGDLESMASPVVGTATNTNNNNSSSSTSANNSNIVLPELFIINFMLPLQSPTMPGLFGPPPEPDGPTVCFHFVMRISEWTRANMDSPAIRLLANFLQNCGDNGNMRERLKIIVQVANPDELQLGRVERGLYRQYNGLPFLYRTYNSKYHVGNGWFQADFDGHRSGYTTRAARFALLSFAERIVANCAFLIEAETDEEMPERILGCCTVHRLRCQNAKPFVKPVATPFSPAPTAPQPLNSNGNTTISYPNPQLLSSPPMMIYQQHQHQQLKPRGGSNLSDFSKSETALFGDALDE
jgi:hypothetical protein